MSPAMATFSPDTTTTEYEHFRNDSTNDSVTDNSNVTSSFDWDMFEFILLTIVSGSICMVGFIANILCFKVLKADSGKKHHAATFLLQALAVADNVVLGCYFVNDIIKGLPTMLDAEHRYIADIIWYYEYVYFIPFLYMARYASVWITVLIAINRYIAVSWPLDAPRLASLKRTKIQVAVVVTLSITLCLIMFFQYTLVYPTDRNTWNMLYETSIGPGTVFGLVYTVLVETIAAAVLPLILLIVLNIKIIWELRKAKKSRNSIQQNGRQTDNNITVVTVVIVIVFIVCNIPFQIHMVVWYITMNQCSDGRYILYCVSKVLLAANSATNFVVYYVLRKSFRHAFGNAMWCCRPDDSVV